jgi:hypothetical protein
MGISRIAATRSLTSSSTPFAIIFILLLFAIFSPSLALRRASADSSSGYRARACLRTLGQFSSERKPSPVWSAA